MRVGPWIAVAGTAPIADPIPEGVYAQTKLCFEIALRAIAEAGGTAESVIRTRVMLVDIREWKEAARAHGELFAETRPACTFFEVRRFIDPAWLVEVELDAYVED